LYGFQGKGYLEILGDPEVGSKISVGLSNNQNNFKKYTKSLGGRGEHGCYRSSCLGYFLSNYMSCLNFLNFTSSKIVLIFLRGADHFKSPSKSFQYSDTHFLPNYPQSSSLKSYLCFKVQLICLLRDLVAGNKPDLSSPLPKYLSLGRYPFYLCTYESPQFGCLEDKISFNSWVLCKKPFRTGHDCPPYL